MSRATRFRLVSLALLVPLFAVAAAAPVFGKVIVMHVALTDDPNIGEDCRIDLGNIHGIFSAYPDMDRLTEFIAIEGRDANHGTIMARLQGLRVGPDDAVMFYYSGHGAEDPATRENYCLLPDGQPLYISQVSRTIAAKNPRLNVVIADMCSVIQRPPRMVYPAPMAGVPPSGIPPALRSLFLVSRGSAIVISSSSGQVAVGDARRFEGGIFTYAFAGAIRAKINQNLTWREVFNDAARKTHEKFVLDNPRGIDIPEAGIISQRTQTPNIVALRITPGGGGTGGGGGSGGSGGGGAAPPPQGRPVFGATVLNNGGDGVIIQSVAPGGPAAGIGFEPNDVLLQFNGVALRSTADYTRAIDASGPDLQVIFRNCRDGQVYSVTIRLNK